METRKEKQNNQYVYSWFFLFAACTIIYQQIQDKYRPNYKGGNETIRYLLGIAPNFLPAIGLPAIFLLLLPLVKPQNSKNVLWSKLKHITAMVISLSGLILWEVIQSTLPKARFDWNDILWTLTGCLEFYCIWHIVPESFRQENKSEAQSS